MNKKTCERETLRFVIALLPNLSSVERLKARVKVVQAAEAMDCVVFEAEDKPTRGQIDMRVRIDTKRANDLVKKLCEISFVTNAGIDRGMTCTKKT